MLTNDFSKPQNEKERKPHRKNEPENKTETKQTENTKVENIKGEDIKVESTKTEVKAEIKTEVPLVEEDKSITLEEYYKKIYGAQGPSRNEEVKPKVNQEQLLKELGKATLLDNKAKKQIDDRNDRKRKLTVYCIKIYSIDMVQHCIARKRIALKDHVHVLT